MKKIIVAILLVLLSGMAASQYVGIGLKWYVESGIVEEETISCQEYGIYNPFDVNVTGHLIAFGGLEKMYIAEEPVVVPAGTSSTNAIPAKICFKIPDVYKEDCIAGFLCEQKCPEEEVVYKGQVAATYRVEVRPGATGSAVGASMAAPLTLTVRCKSYPIDYTPLYYLIGFIAVAVIAGIGGMKYRARKPPEVRRAEKIKKLERKIEKLKKK
jgi:general stress protein CsbA